MLAVLLIFRTTGLITGLQKPTFYSWNDLQPMFSLHSTCASLLNKSSQRRMAARREGGWGWHACKRWKAKATCKNSSLWISALILPYSMPNVYLKTQKYHQFRMYFLPLLEVLFCHQICWTINLIQLPKDKKLAVGLFCFIYEKVRLSGILFIV